MQVDPREHLARPLLIHALASDFELLDVWRLPVESERPEASFELFLNCFPLLSPTFLTTADGPTRFLFAVRDVLLRVLRVESEDDIVKNLPIPGCRETSLRERMTQADRERFEVAATPKAKLSPVYGTPNERVYEVSNGTVHAALVLYWQAEAASHRAYMAIYSKSRGWLGRAYMALISPFRYWIVYPALLKATSQAWQQASTRIRLPAAP